MERDRQEIERWWPHNQAPARDHSSKRVADLMEHFGHVELCPACYERYGDPDEWTDELLNVVDGPEDDPPAATRTLRRVDAQRAT